MATTGSRAPKDDAPKESNERAESRNLEADIQQLRDDISQLTEHLMQLGNRSMFRARRAASEQADHLRGSAEEFQDDVIESVREKPITALALAAGAGFLLAMMMRR
ncbi:hypothetical protein [Chelativorans sp. AA-79]|uniref:hypothetical protein n=1 Tax=Chelativorans sp. AA-79 TaxID=3028735 RepID=UPI0023F7F508|nr:hypothetical protein [Chelativorans sp. AA-79]WEX10043.1 hypothetical protein PVE73_03495 [Chelativorans sp. AA-79]